MKNHGGRETVMDMYEQLNDYLHKVGVEVKIERKTTFERKYFPEGSRHYDVIVSNKSGDSFRTVYSQGPAIKADPSLVAVLYSLVMDLDYRGLSFECFCSNMGYDPDSKSDYRLYMDAKALSEDTFSVLGDDIVCRIRTIVQNY